MVRTTLTTGSWRSYEQSGDGDLDPVAYTLHRGESEEQASDLAQQVVWALIAHADRKAMLQLADGQVVVHPVAESS
ncbi:hypothetical protein [Nocardia sp. bgisy134]|uniref:hypothetical protein n=1 Tax=Nocardia sp. bgisy134 TaxID=3413789 RepID=UPI003D752382